MYTISIVRVEFTLPSRAYSRMILKFKPTRSALKYYNVR